VAISGAFATPRVFVNNIYENNNDDQKHYLNVFGDQEPQLPVSNLYPLHEKQHSKFSHVMARWPISAKISGSLDEFKIRSKAAPRPTVGVCG
jgi:hypothetical protein